MPKPSLLIVPSVLAALAATATPAIANPAMANPAMHGPAYHNSSAHHADHRRANDLRRDIARLDSRIDRALANRRISPREAKGLRHETRDLQRLLNQSRRGGLTRFEARKIEARLATANRMLRAERHDRDRHRG